MRSVIICSNESRTKEILPCVDSGIHCSILTGGNSRLIAMQRMRRIFGPGPSIFIKNMAAIIERVYQVSKYEGRERENQCQWHLARAECAFLAPAAAFHIPYNLKLDRLNRAE